MTKPLYFYNGSTFEEIGPTTPQSPIAYQTSAPTGPATGDLWIDSDGDVDTYNRQLTRYYFVATAAQTTITGTDANGLTLAYVAGSEAVYVNGALQVRGQDYTATNGTSVVLTAALAVNDVVEIFAYTAFTVANTYTKTEIDGLVNTSAGLKLLTPTSVAVGSGTGSVNTNGTVTFSGASSVSLNGVFSTTYDNYVIRYSYLGSAASTSDLRLRVSGTDNSAANYQRQLMNVNNASTSFTRITGQTTWVNAIAHDTTTSWLSLFEIHRPFNTSPTSAISLGTDEGNTELRAVNTYYRHTTSTSFDGFSMLVNSGNITGTVSVYGYKD